MVEYGWKWVMARSLPNRNTIYPHIFLTNSPPYDIENILKHIKNPGFQGKIASFVILFYITYIVYL
jgi:hypothetical protein